MNDSQVSALAVAAEDGVDFDGLAVEADGDRFVAGVVDGSETVVHEQDLGNALREYAEYVSNWYVWHETAPQSPDRWAFLRWLEGADERAVPERYDALTDGITRTWGELSVTITLASDGHREYRLCHEADADEPDAALTDYEDPLDARELAKHDDRGRYRPLKTAPTLQTGWQFPALGPGELVDAVDFFYPASVANWHREREGELDVSHWRETVERQTGIYGVVKTWDRQDGHEHVDWVAEACCDDSQCLKRREWEYDAETDLDVDGGASTTPRDGDGATAGDGGGFPCREPCSVVISAARRWTKLEGEQTRTYEFDLTPSEKEQVEEIIDAVADGRTEEIREADVYDGANRYRARFLRAKRFDDEGNLCGVPTGEDTDEADH